jgi:hypothetical protein
MHILRISEQPIVTACERLMADVVVSSRAIQYIS